MQTTVPSALPVDIAESNWSLYVRMMGAVTIVAMCVGTLLHQLYCELSDQPSHAMVSSMLVILCIATLATLLLAGRMGRNQSIVLATICAALATAFMSAFELCTTHQVFGVALLTISVMFVASCARRNRVSRHTANSLEVDAPSSPATESLVMARQSSQESFAAENACEIVEQHDEVFASHDQVLASRPFWMRHATLTVFGALFFVYMVIVPAIGMIVEWLSPVMSRELTDMSLLESIRLQTVSGVVTFIFLAIGASVGSFLNVVIFRLPRSLPLLWPPSACVACKTKIEGKDNIPVISWLKLAGRCRQCGTSISARYPIVESVVGGIFVTFFFRELLSGGVNLPVRQPNSYAGIVWILLYTKWDLLSIYFFHMVLVVILLAWGMINLDRFRVPARSVLFAAAGFILLPAIFPHLNPMAALWEERLSFLPFGFAASAVTSVVGCCFGLGLAMIYSGLNLARGAASETTESKSVIVADTLPTLDADPQQIETLKDTGSLPIDEPNLYGSTSRFPESRSDIAGSLMIVGAALGAEAVCIVSVLALAIWILIATLRAMTSTGLKSDRRPIPSTLLVCAATLVLLLFWGQFHEAASALPALLSPISES